MKKSILLVFISFVLFSCQNMIKRDNELVSYNGFPDSVTNFSLVNSAFDDYNSAQQGDGEEWTFIFSSNRKSKGKDFDIVQYTLSWYYDFEDDITTIRVDTGGDSKIREMLKIINTPKNEFGPYIFDVSNSFEYLLFYAQEDSNKLNLKFMTNRVDSIHEYMHYLSVYGPYDVGFINQLDHNEAYICLDQNTIYYCSDKNGNYDIYHYPLGFPSNRASTYIDLLTNKKPDERPTPAISLNSPMDDKCPYATNDFMVFSSNRAGGFGGYDLWYSRLVDDQWTEPENFGAEINSPYDEYRPIVKKCIPNDLMIFSSNRPGGKGGFDLYYVGINRNGNFSN